MSETYSCGTCTFEQSTQILLCQMCGALNPYMFDKEAIDKYGEEAIKQYLLTSGAESCPHCQYVNIGFNLETCQNCRKNLKEISRSSSPTFEIVDDGEIPTPNEESPAAESEMEETTIVENDMTDDQLTSYYNRYIRIVEDQKEKSKIFTVHQLKRYIAELFRTVNQENEELGNEELVSAACQVCCEENRPMVTMKKCGHQVICQEDFRCLIITRLKAGDILPWISCPCATCSISCHPDNLTNDAQLTYDELSSFLTTYMLKKLSRNSNFVLCQNCERGGFLQLGPSRKESVKCPICQEKQTIEKDMLNGLDKSFKQMIKDGHLRPCPQCRHLTFKEKGICNVIQCVKCAMWWNWKTKETGNNEKEMKKRARLAGTLWEQGELEYQTKLQTENPEEFRALLERNGNRYNPQYVRGDFDD